MLVLLVVFAVLCSIHVVIGWLLIPFIMMVWVVILIHAAVLVASFLLACLGVLFGKRKAQSRRIFSRKMLTAFVYLVSSIAFAVWWLLFAPKASY